MSVESAVPDAPSSVSVAYPDFVDRAVPVVGSPRLNGYDLLLWTTQLEVIENAYACDCRYDEAGEIVGMIGTLATWSPQFHARETPHEAAEEFIAGAKRGGRSIVMLDYAAQLRAMIDHDVSADRRLARGGSPPRPR